MTGRLVSKGVLSRGLTLVELLITLSFIGLVAATVLSVFSAGFRIWGRLQPAQGQGPELQLAFEQIRRDLSNARPFQPIGFRGEYDEFSFPKLVPVAYPGEAGETEAEELGRVTYFFDSLKRVLCRTEHSYRLIRKFYPKERPRQVLTGAERARFQYLKADSDGKTAWVDHWEEEEGTPLAVKAEVGTERGGAGRPEKQSLIVPLPAAYPPEKEEEEKQ